MKELEELGYSVEEVKKMHKQSSVFKSFCFQLMREYGNDDKKLYSVLAATGLYLHDVVYHANLYKNERKIDYSNPAVVQKRKDIYVQAGYNNSKSAELIKELLAIDLSDEGSIVAFFTKNPNVYKNPPNYTGVIINTYNDSFKIKLQEYKKRLIVFRDYLMRKKALSDSHQEEAKNEKLKKEASELFYKILSDNEVGSFNDVMKKYHVSEKKLAKINDILKTIMYDDKITLYEKIQEKLKENKSHLLDEYVEDVLKLLPLINKGILVGNVKRSFDIFDCYTYFGEHISKIIDVLRYKIPTLNNLGEDDYNAISKLKAILLKYSRKTTDYYSGGVDNADEEYKKEFIQKAYRDTLEINQEIIDGELVHGSGHIVTESEKSEIFRVIEDYHIPFNSEMYLLATKRLNNGHLELITPDTINDYLVDDNTKRGTK